MRTGDGLGEIGPARETKQILGEVILWETQQTLTDELIEENMVTIIGVERGHSQDTIVVSLEIEVQVVVDLGQDQGQVLMEIEFNATSVENVNISQGTVPLLKREIHQLQQMLNLGNEQTLPKTPITATQDSFIRSSSEENLGMEHLNL